MVNICTDFNLSKTTSHIKNINKLLPFIYITSPASSRLVTVIQNVSLLLSAQCKCCGMQLHDLARVLEGGDGGADTPQLLPAGQHEYCQAPLFLKKSILYMHGHLYLLKNGQALFVTVIWMDIF
jgi:hypothetical protein